VANLNSPWQSKQAAMPTTSCRKSYEARAAIDPELCFTVPVAAVPTVVHVAVAVADPRDVFVAAPDPSVTCAAVAIAGEPPQYSSKYWTSAAIWWESC
jgi:hypothetical protein